MSAIAFRVARADAHYWTIDDAGITYAAAYELADHGSLAPNVEGTPVESYSNPLLFFVTVLLRLLGLFDPVRTHVHLETLVFGGMITLLWSTIRARTSELVAVAATTSFLGLELITPATWLWYGSGLENVWVAAGLILLLWSAARVTRGVRLTPLAGAAAFLVAITRPEAPVYVAAYYFALATVACPEGTPMRTHLRSIARALAVTVALYCVFLLWRRLGYGDWWPNTYYAKVTGDVSVGEHFRDYVMNHVFRYCWALLFASSVLALLLTATFERIALILVILLAASLTLPVTAGTDWMGEHRFATQFFVLAHASYAALFAVCATKVVTRVGGRLQWRSVVTLLVALGAPGLLLCDRIAIRDHTPLNEVTLGHIAHGQGGVRWEHQMRLGLPYPVVMLPDAGGSLLVGGMQFLDSATLADFQLSRIRKYDPALSRTLINQYQHEERRPDLVHFNTASAFVEQSYYGVTYVRNETHLAARRDLVVVDAIDPAARVVYQSGSLTIYLSPETVQRAAPGALVRCEILLAWTDSFPVNARAVVSIAGDRDEISLEPYQTSGIQRRALLVGAPRQPGVYPVQIEILRDGAPPQRAPLFELRVAADDRDLADVANQLVAGASPARAIRRIAWLREQLVPRFTTQEFHRILDALHRERLTSANAGQNVERLRWNARLAAFESLPAAIRTAEATTSRRYLSTCAPATPDDAAVTTRTVCLGRAIDELRRLGYLRMLEREPAIAAELERVAARLGQLTPALRYRALVGLTLADPGDLTLQRKLLATRREVALAGAFPAL